MNASNSTPSRVADPAVRAADATHESSEPAALPAAARPSEEAASLYKLLVESVRDYAIFALDSTGHILTWNIGAERIKGYTAQEAIGQHLSIFYSREDRERARPERELAAAIADGRIEDEGWRLRKDGSRFWANVVITALRDPNGTLVGFAKVTRDLTERRSGEQRAIEDARRIAGAESAIKTKSEFLAAMSHELRTPLNAIGGYADLLLLGISGDLTAKQRDYINRLRHSQQHLLAIINDLLNFSRIEAGRVTYDLQSMSLGQSIRRVLPMVELQTRERGLNVRVVTTADHRVLADPAKVEQILLNLLSNAAKFTARGGSITIEQIAESGHAGVRLTDTGIGIAPGMLEAIFEPFVQVGRTHATPREGAGLGLAISRDLARAMGGDITLQSTLEVGSAFELRLRKG
jgi:PAS domain S-box-containing protein